MYTGVRSPVFVGTFLLVVVLAITFAFAPWQVSKAVSWLLALGSCARRQDVPLSSLLDPLDHMHSALARPCVDKIHGMHLLVGS